MKVAYLLYNERPMSGLVRSQVMEPLIALKQRRPEWDVTLIGVWQPWVAVRQRDALSRMAETLEAAGISVESWPTAVVPSRYFQYDARLLPILINFNHATFSLLRLDRFDLVHPRAYVSAVATVLAYPRRRFRLVFDPRSLFPEEWVTTGHWTLGSPTYLAWKSHERRVMRSADAAIAVSEAMTARMRAEYPETRTEHIGLAANVRELRFDPEARKAVREAHNLTDRFVFLFQGSLGHSTQGNSIETYAQYAPRILRAVPSAFFLFVTPQVLPGFAPSLRDAGVPDDRMHFVQGDGDLRDWLSAGDAGMHLMRVGPDADTRFGVKVVEYLAAGLPIVTNSGVGAAAQYVERHDCGLRLDLDDQRFEDAIARLAARPYDREKLRALAVADFGADRIAHAWEQLYASLSSRSRDGVRG